MQENVGVGVALQPKVGINGDAADHEWPAGGDPVVVPAQAGPELHHQARAVSCARSSRASSISAGLVILIFRSLPATTETSSSSSRSTRLDSSVPVKPSARARW